MSLALISVTRDIAERTSFGGAIKEESGFVGVFCSVAPKYPNLLPVRFKSPDLCSLALSCHCASNDPPNLRNAFDLSPSAAEPHMSVLAFYSERRCEILDGKTLTCLLERCQD